MRECVCGSKQDSWVLYDGRGIYISRVCEKCVERVEKRYRPVILNTAYTQADVDEPIEPEDYY